MPDEHTESLRAAERRLQAAQLASDVGVCVTWFLGAPGATIDGQPPAARMRYTRTWIPHGRDGRKGVAAHATFVADPLFDP